MRVDYIDCEMQKPSRAEKISGIYASLSRLNLTLHAKECARNNFRNWRTPFLCPIIIPASGKKAGAQLSYSIILLTSK